VLLLGTGAIPRTAAVRDALDGRGIPALHTYRARGVLPDSGAEAAGLVTGGTMEWPLLSAALTDALARPGPTVIDAHVGRRR
jgi:hypothetical protein